MRCAKCRADNREGARFCDNCGAKLSPKCASCGAENRTDAKFCDSCGAALGADAAVAALAAVKPNDTPIRVAETSAPEKVEGERKTVTALFADIKGSMELIEDLDPEEARAIVDPALKLMMEAVHRYAGYVAQSTGDGIFALFGAPVAHEDHPQRALYAALRMQEELKRYSDKLRERGEPPISIRVGINTGEVVVRTIRTDDAHTEYVPIGHSTSLAARLQALAAPGSIAISETVRKLVEGYFTLKPLGPARIKGVTEAVNVYEVLGLGPLRTRLQHSASRGLSQFVGRDAEIAQMKRALEQAKASRGQVVAAMAEPGVGKSRLFFEFKAVAQSGCMVLEALSISHGKASPYLPVIDLLHGYFKIISDDDPRTRREKVGGRLLMLDRSLEDALPYLFELLGIVEEADPLAGMDVQIKRRRMLDAIKRILLRESLSQPLIVIFEDLHLIDGETQALLNLLAGSIGTARILLLVNYRPEYHHEWGSKTYYTQLRLDPLGKENAREMLDAVLGYAVELAPLKRLIIDKTEGNPFFMEEMVQAVFDEGTLARNGSTVKLTKSLSQLKIPPSVQAILASRVDRLPPDEKDLLQTLAVLGREFSFVLVKSVVSKSEDELNRMLSDLQLGEFIYEQPASGEVEYIFKHALTQEVAYNSMLLERRKALHERVGLAAEAMYRDSLEDHVFELAHHFSSSDDALKTLEYLKRAARWALHHSAYQEADERLRAAALVLDRLPRSDREHHELEVLLLVSELAVLLKGLGASEVRDAASRALTIAEAIGDRSSISSASELLYMYHATTNPPDYLACRKIAERQLASANESGQPVALINAHERFAHIQTLTADLADARKHFEKAIALHELASDLAHLVITQLSHSHIMFGFAVCGAGYADQGVMVGRRIVDQVRPTDNATLISSALTYLARSYQLRGDLEAVLAAAEEVVSIAETRSLPYWLSAGLILKGLMIARRGVMSRATELTDQGLQMVSGQAQGTAPHIFRVSAMAEIALHTGDFESGLGALETEEASAWIKCEGVFPLWARILRGELLMLRSRDADLHEAEQTFRYCVDYTRPRGAKLFELIATHRLARLLQKQGRDTEARAMLSDIYNWFTEGFDTEPLKDAKALLEELSDSKA